ncbi:MAG TPA: phosphatidylcholine/phosphatidylserine synthase [Terriglobales bacterium]|nr:phosphatidylcholine/phosphatidylserine synthase [Terriglobales bacterium]
MTTQMRRFNDPGQKRRLRRGMHILPSLFTTGNVALGYFAIFQAITATPQEPWHLDNAAKAIGIAIVMDFMDGMIARLTQTASDFGRELDSLADVISFGVAPAVLAWVWGFRWLPLAGMVDWRAKLVQIGAIASFLFLIAGASRLARFNIQKNPTPSNPGRPDRKYFVGMPIPAGAGVIAAVVHFSSGWPLEAWWLATIWVALLVACGFLMVSTWRYVSLKGLDWRKRVPFRTVILIAAFIAGVWFFSRYVLFLLALTYMLSGVLARLQWIFRRKSPPPPPASSYQEAPQHQ